MFVVIRIYRRHDADLIMLQKAYGLSISKLTRLALENYVAGRRIKFRLPDARRCDISDTSMLRYRLEIKDAKIVRLLKGIKQGYRNQFCKMLLRDMLDSIALGVYMDDSTVTGETARLSAPASVARGTLGSGKLPSAAEILQAADGYAEADSTAVNSTVAKIQEAAAAEEAERFEALPENIKEMIGTAPPAEDDIYNDSDDVFGGLDVEENADIDEEAAQKERESKRNAGLFAMFQEMRLDSD